MAHQSLHKDRIGVQGQGKLKISILYSKYNIYFYLDSCRLADLFTVGWRLPHIGNCAVLSPVLSHVRLLFSFLYNLMWNTIHSNLSLCLNTSAMYFSTKFFFQGSPLWIFSKILKKFPKFLKVMEIALFWAL